MGEHTGFRIGRVELPRRGIDMRKWAVVACDQYTSEPEYWEQVAREVGDAPSTLHLILPEAFLGRPQAAARIRAIQDTMRCYLADGVLREHRGAVYVERMLGDRVRRGLMLELDLEHYDYTAGSSSLIRPTEGTIVERLAPRIEVRSGAALELPHILVLIDDPAGTVIEPIGAQRAGLEPLYESELMLGGGRIAGYAVDERRAQAAARALDALADPQSFAARYEVPAGSPPMLFAVGDGNHSLAAAKAIWERTKASVGMDHPARFALVEVENIHDPALDFAPIHRLLLNVSGDVLQAMAGFFGSRLSSAEVPDAVQMRRRLEAAPPARHAAGLIGPGPRYRLVEIAEPRASLAVGTFQSFVEHWIGRGGAAEVDYVHGDDVLERLATEGNNAGLHLAAVSKGELLLRVVREGPLPRKTFSMGEAHEKRYYVEARRIR
jgi:hypothetical protein